MNKSQLLPFLCIGLIAAATNGCSIKRMAVNKVGDALSGSGTTFASDDDPELVKQAIPFSLKLMESLLSESPKHKGLLKAASSGFTQYAFAFVQEDADELESKDLAGAEVIRARAKRLYLRARSYGLRGLEAAHAGFTHSLAKNPRQAVSVLKKKDVPQIYWTAAAWGSAISLSKDDAGLIAEIPQMEALIDRAVELDESWGDGSLHSFLINMEMSRQGVSGDPALRAKKQFDRAAELAEGKQAGPFVTYAEAVCIQQQDAKQFEDLLNRALAINPDTNPDFRLTNLIMQRRARWLLSKKEDLFLLPAKPVKPSAR